jgi:ABC-type sugar transport system permease subunit
MQVGMGAALSVILFLLLAAFAALYFQILKRHQE